VRVACVTTRPPAHCPIYVTILEFLLNVVKIGSTIQYLEYFFDIQDNNHRSLKFCFTHVAMNDIHIVRYKPTKLLTLLEIRSGHVGKK